VTLSLTGDDDDHDDPDDLAKWLEELMEEHAASDDEGEGDGGMGVDIEVDLSLAAEPADVLWDDAGLVEEEPAADATAATAELDGLGGETGADPDVLTVGPLAESTSYEPVKKDVQTRVDEFVDLLKLSFEFAEAVSLQPISNGGISLVVHGDEVMWVRWTEAAVFQARQLTVHGHENAIKAIVANRVPKIELVGCKIVLSNAPVTMKMRTESFADRMPEWCMRLYIHHLTQQFCGPLDKADSKTGCCIVCVAGDAYMVRSGFDDWDIFRCKTCLTTWHLECARCFRGVRFYPAAVCSFDFRCPICVER
jgi:hypothetical protein